MLGHDEPAPRRVALRRHTGALLVASLLSLLASQPFHERAAPSTGAAALVAAGSGAEAGAPARAADHDRDHCLQCRAVAQTRLALRAPVFSGAPTAQGAAFALRDAAELQVASAPARGPAAPRAPPAPLPVQHS